MQLTDSDVKEFQRLYEIHFKKKISHELARAEALKLITLVALLQKHKNG